MKAGWKKTQLGDVIDIHDSRRIPLSGAQRSQRQGKYPYYGAQSIIDYIDDYIFDGKFLLIAEDGENLRSRKEPIASFACGKFWVNNHAHIVTAKPELADDYFIKACLNSANLAAYVTGAAQPKLSQGNLKQIEIDLPDLPTQRKISGILSAYDDLIENNLRRIKILEEMAQSLYREWFVHFRFPGHESVGFADSELGKIPKGWNATTLGEFVENKSVHLQTGPFGTQLKASHYSHEGTPVINVRNIGFGTLRAEKLEFLPPDKVDELKRHQLRSGDIVFGRKGAVERHLLVGPVEDGWIQGSDCIRLRVVSGPLTPRFLSIGFREVEHQRWMMNQCSGAATMASLNQDILCRIPLAVPPPELIARFDKFATSAVDQVDVLASKIQTLRRTRNLLLPKLISSHSESKSNKNPV